MQHIHASRWAPGHRTAPAARDREIAGHDDHGPGLLVSRAFWLAGLASLGAWAGIGWLVMQLF